MPRAPSGCPDDAPAAWLVTTINSAELIKHASNSFLAVKISYANMVADLAESLGADIEEVMRAVGMDPRIGPSFLHPGLGFGGFCLPKDLQAFVYLAEKSGVDFSMLKEAEKINKKRIDHFMEKIRRASVGSERKADRRSRSCIQTKHRRHPLRPGHRSDPAIDHRKAHESAPSIPKPWKKRIRCCRRFTTQNQPMKQPRAPRHC